jgi:hypothetical protein
MDGDVHAISGRKQTRRELLHHYVRLQHELAGADPAASSYSATIQSFRQLGYALITAGFEEDLDRLLRIRVLDGGKATPSRKDERQIPADLLVIESRPARAQ